MVEPEFNGDQFGMDSLYLHHAYDNDLLQNSECCCLQLALNG